MMFIVGDILISSLYASNVCMVNISMVPWCLNHFDGCLPIQISLKYLMSHSWEADQLSLKTRDL